MRHYLIIFANWRWRKSFESNIAFGVLRKSDGRWIPFPDQTWHFACPIDNNDLDRLRGYQYESIQTVGDVNPEFVEYANALLLKRI